jgi:hypothetical protein
VRLPAPEELTFARASSVAGRKRLFCVALRATALVSSVSWRTRSSGLRRVQPFLAWRAAQFLPVVAPSA